MALGSDLPEDKTPPLPANLHCCALEVSLIAFLTRGTFQVSAAAPPNTWGQKNSTCFTSKVLRSQKQAVGEGRSTQGQSTRSCLSGPKLSIQAPLLLEHVPSQARSAMGTVVNALPCTRPNPGEG